MNTFSVYWKQAVSKEFVDITNVYYRKIVCLVEAMSENEYEYCKEIKQFHITFRISGSFYRFDDPEGCNALRLFKKKNVICNSISFDENIYSNENVLKEFLKKNIKLACNQMIKRLEKEKIIVDGEKILNDLENNVDKYL